MRPAQSMAQAGEKATPLKRPGNSLRAGQVRPLPKHPLTVWSAVTEQTSQALHLSVAPAMVAASASVAIGPGKHMHVVKQ